MGEQVAAALFLSDGLLESAEEIIEPSWYFFWKGEDLLGREPFGSDVHPGVVGCVIVVLGIVVVCLGIGGGHEGLDLKVTFKSRDGGISVV